MRFLVTVIGIVLLTACGKDDEQKSVTTAQRLDTCSDVDFMRFSDYYVRAKVENFYKDKIAGGFSITDVNVLIPGSPVGDASKPIYLLQAEYTLSTGLKGEVVEAGYLDENCSYSPMTAKMGKMDRRVRVRAE